MEVKKMIALMPSDNSSFIKLVKETRKILEENNPKKIKRCYIFQGDILSYKNKTITGIEITSEEGFVLIFDDDTKLVVELDQEYENINRPPRYSLFTSLIGKLRGKKVIEAELLAKDSFRLVFDDGDILTVRTRMIDEKFKDKERTLEAVMRYRNGKQMIVF